MLKFLLSYLLDLYNFNLNDSVVHVSWGCHLSHYLNEDVSFFLITYFTLLFKKLFYLTFLKFILHSNHSFSSPIFSHSLLWFLSTSFPSTPQAEVGPNTSPCIKAWLANSAWETGSQKTPKHLEQNMISLLGALKAGQATQMSYTCRGCSSVPCWFPHCSPGYLVIPRVQVNWLCGGYPVLTLTHPGSYNPCSCSSGGLQNLAQCLCLDLSIYIHQLTIKVL